MSDMAITSLARPSSSVRCAICARPARRGATLCAQCKAAVKRARQVPSVHSEYLPHPAAATGRASSRESGETRAFPGSRVASLRAPGSWGIYGTLVAFGVAVCLTGYLALGEFDDRSNPGHAWNSAEGTTSGVSSEGAERARLPLTSLAVDDPVRAESPNPADASEAQRSSAASDPAEKRSLRDPRPSAENQPLPAYEASYAIAEPIASPAREAPAAPPPPVVAELPEPAAPDRWQLLASATARCERENLIAGLLCKERARLQYCEGYWGTAPQCSASVAATNTR